MLKFKSIRTKMLFGFSIVVILVVLLGTYILNTFYNNNQTVVEIKDVELPLLIADEQLALLMSNRIAMAREYITSGNSDYKDSFNQYSEESKEIQDKVIQIGTSKDFEKNIDKTAEWREFIETKVFGEYDKGNEEVAFNNLNESSELSQDLMRTYQDAAETREKNIMDIENDVLAEGKMIFVVVGIIVILVVLLSILVAFITANSIAKPIRIVMERMRLIASGDLSSEPLKTNLKDEIGQLIVSTNEMSSNSHSLLDQINSVAGTVSTQSEELTQSANEVKEGSKQIAITMEELANGAESQADNSNDLVSGMKSFVDKVANANENGGFIQQASNSVIEMTNEGSKLMSSSTKQMDVIDRIVHEAVTKVEGLDEHTQEISELVSVIQDIADQTNLLALNAAIEAARAGEQGKGFAVVADEVRVLAEQSSDSVSNITDIVSRIQNESNFVTGSLREGYKEVEEGTSQIAITGETFGKISKAVTEMVERIQIISQNLNEITNDSQVMSGSIQEIAAVTEESAAGVEETSASSEQANSAMEEVAKSSNDLSALAEELNKLVSQFKL